MRIPRVFVDQPLSTDQQIALPAETAHYLLRVLRLSDAAPVRVFNGRGGEYSGTLKQTGKNTLAVALNAFDPNNRSSALRTHLGIVISRGERMDWVVQKATELGVSSLTPLYSERCEVKLRGDRLSKKLEHWRKVSISACEQSGLNLVPEIGAPVPLSDWLTSANSQLKLILHPGPAQPLEQGDNPETIALLIGPEGGFTEQEVELASRRDFTPLQLGPRVLRTETAPIAALSILQYRWGDLGDISGTAD